MKIHFEVGNGFQSTISMTSKCLQHALKTFYWHHQKRERGRKIEENILINIFSTRNLQVKSDVIKMAIYIPGPRDEAETCSFLDHRD